MSRKGKKKEEQITWIALLTAILYLIAQVIDLITKLIE